MDSAVWWSKFKSDSSPRILFWQHHVCQPPNLASDQHFIFGIFEHLPLYLCIGPFQKVTKWLDCLNRAITWWDDSKRRTGSKASKADAAFDGQKNSWATISGFSLQARPHLTLINTSSRQIKDITTEKQQQLCHNFCVDQNIMLTRSIHREKKRQLWSHPNVGQGSFCFELKVCWLE